MCESTDDVLEIEGWSDAETGGDTTTGATKEGDPAVVALIVFTFAPAGLTGDMGRDTAGVEAVDGEEAALAFGDRENDNMFFNPRSLLVGRGDLATGATSG